MDCKTCGNHHAQKFCPACGEQAFHTHQLSVKHFIEETFEGLMHFDNKLLRTIRVTVTKPGQLSLDYTEGRRANYMKPVQFFLVINLLFFILAFTNIYSLKLYNYTHYTPFTNFNTQNIVKNHLAKAGIKMDVYEPLFDEKMKEVSKEYIFLFIPVYGLIFCILFFKRKAFFVEHLVFAAHFYAFVLLLALVSLYGLGIPFLLFNPTGPSPWFDKFYMGFNGICIGIYLMLAINRFYKPHIFWTLLTTVVIAFTFFPLIQYYRILLFFKMVYWP